MIYITTSIKDFMGTELFEFLPDIQSIDLEPKARFALFCNSAKRATAIQQDLLHTFHIHSVTDCDNNGIHYIIPFETPDNKTTTQFIRNTWSWDKDQPIIQYLLTFYTTDATQKMYNILLSRGHNITLLPNNLQLVIQCPNDSEHNTEMQKLKSELEIFDKSHPQSMDEYFNKMLFSGKIENTKYRTMRKQEFDITTVEQNKDLIIRGILYQYFNKKIRAHLFRLTFPRKFDANKLDSKIINNIYLIRDFLYSVTEEYLDKQVKTATQTKHPVTIRFDYLKSCNDYDGFKQVLKLAKTWHCHKIVSEKIHERNLRLANKGAYKIMDLNDDYYVAQLFTPAALDYEGEVLEHCVGDGYYDNKVHEPGTEIYSIRNKRGVSYLTLEVNNAKVVQCFGYKNNVPCDASLRKAVRTFMRQENLTVPDTGWNKLIAYIKQDGVLYDLFDLPEHFVSKHGMDLAAMNLDKLPNMSKAKINGDFGCPTNKLSNLEGAPYTVTGDCKFSNNPLTSLRGLPHNIGGVIYLFNTKLTKKSFVPIYLENKLDCIIGPEDETIAAWKEQIALRKASLGNILASLSQKAQK